MAYSARKLAVNDVISDNLEVARASTTVDSITSVTETQDSTNRETEAIVAGGHSYQKARRLIEISHVDANGKQYFVVGQ